eukprot:6490695-Amphidinium_carterae.1
MKDKGSWIQRLRIKTALTDKVRLMESLLVQAAPTCAEAKLLGVIQDKKQTEKARKAKIETTFSSLSKQSKELNVDLTTKIHPVLLKQATELVMKSA